MFTGLIEELGTIKKIQRHAKGLSLTIQAQTILEDMKLGDSIATHGVCLTVTHIGKHDFEVDVVSDTVNSTIFKAIKLQQKVHLERAMRSDGRFGGHFVSGHVDGVGKILSRTKDGLATRIHIEVPPPLKKGCLTKGSIAINGVSLTIQEVTSQGCVVSIIPTTSTWTTLLDEPLHGHVNIELDMLIKPSLQSSSKIDEDFLKKHGYIT
ncbi:MAG: riboflavin synthase [Erysipelotrichia bacterium]|jgi:riboflavin synthase|nr:riboflavin synthase [Erysipelotrichia bacterium]